MPILGDVRALIVALISARLRSVLLDHGVDLNAVNLEAELCRALNGIQRTSRASRHPPVRITSA